MLYTIFFFFFSFSILCWRGRLSWACTRKKEWPFFPWSFFYLVGILEMVPEIEANTASSKQEESRETELVHKILCTCYFDNKCLHLYLLLKKNRGEGMIVWFIAKRVLTDTLSYNVWFNHFCIIGFLSHFQFFISHPQSSARNNLVAKFLCNSTFMLGYPISIK